MNTPLHICLVIEPSYSTNLNPIENVFDYIKSRLNSRPGNREILKNNIETAIAGLENFFEYYLKFWETIHAINNRHLE